MTVQTGESQIKVMVVSSNFNSLIPPAWRAQVDEHLSADERVVACLPLDLDEQGRFTSGILVLTNLRLLVRHDGLPWREWLLRPDQHMERRDHAGVGTLLVYQSGTRLLKVHHTLDHLVAARNLVAQFEGLSAKDGSATASLHWCDRCGATMDEQDGECASCTETADGRETGWALLRLWRFAHPYRFGLFAGFLLTLGATAATLVPPYLTMPLMDKILIPYERGHHIDSTLVADYLLALLAAAVMAWLLGWARTLLLARVSERICMDLRVATFEHLQKLSLAYFGGKRTGDLVNRIGSESDRISVFLSLHLLDFVIDVLIMLMTAAILMSINLKLALVTLLPIPLIVWMIHLVRDRLRLGFEKVDRVWGEISNVLTDTIPGIRVVKAFAQESREIDRFREANRHNLRINDRVNAVWALFSPSVTLLTEVGLLVVWAFGIWQVGHRHITVGVLTAFLTYISRFYARLDSMSRIVSVTQKASAAARRIFDILDQVPGVPEAAEPVQVPRLQGAISLRHVGFRYGARSVIADMNLDIAPGEMIGLVGHSGSGKSTLVNLICRFYDVTEGAVLIDGVDIRQLALNDYRRHIGLVLQEPFLFFGTIAENIAYGRPDATHEEIVAAARAAHAHEFILRLPHGYDSQVGERGHGLSGGERQRISIARALLIDPRILILDEATASVDTETEREIQAALENLVRGRTTIAVAHRLSTLRHADRLVVLDRGRIVEVGRHETLLAMNGAYAQLYEAQARQIDAGEEETDEPD